MRKFVTLVLASIIVGTTPVLAADAEATALPKALTDLGITSEDLKDIDSAVVDQATTQEADILRRWGRGRDHRRGDRRGDRYCPRGYHLEAYRVRIGRFVIVRYRCERNHRRHWDNQTPAEQQSVPEQTIE